MPIVINNQFIDATNADGGMILIEEMQSDTAGRCGWTVLEEEQ